MSVSSITYSPTTGAVTKGQATQAASESTSLFGQVWDTINPLQHIPIVSNLYRSVTGEGISSFANIAGSTLYGGPIGGAIAVASEIGNAVFGDDKEDATKTALAANTPAENSQIEPSAGDQLAANNAYKKMRVTTQDWLNANFDETPARQMTV